MYPKQFTIRRKDGKQGGYSDTLIGALAGWQGHRDTSSVETEHGAGVLVMVKGVGAIDPESGHSVYKIDWTCTITYFQSTPLTSE